MANGSPQDPPIVSSPLIHGLKTARLLRGHHRFRTTVALLLLVLGLSLGLQGIVVNVKDVYIELETNGITRRSEVECDSRRT